MRLNSQNQLAFISSWLNFTILFEYFFPFLLHSLESLIYLRPHSDTFPPSLKMKNSNSATANWLHYLFYIKSSINYSISRKAEACSSAVAEAQSVRGGIVKGSMSWQTLSCLWSLMCSLASVFSRSGWHACVTDGQYNCSGDQRTVRLEIFGAHV